MLLGAREADEWRECVTAVVIKNNNAEHDTAPPPPSDYTSPYLVDRTRHAITRVTRPMARMREALAPDLGILYSLSMHHGI